MAFPRVLCIHLALLTLVSCSATQERAPASSIKDLVLVEAFTDKLNMNRPRFQSPPVVVAECGQLSAQENAFVFHYFCDELDRIEQILIPHETLLASTQRLVWQQWTNKAQVETLARGKVFRPQVCIRGSAFGHKCEKLETPQLRVMTRVRSYSTDLSVIKEWK